MDDVREITLYDRYGAPVLTGIRICARCGAVVADDRAHDSFHAVMP